MKANNSQSTILLISTALGALVGLSVGFMLVKRAEENEGAPAITAREGASLGMMVLGLLRQVSQLGEGK